MLRSLCFALVLAAPGLAHAAEIKPHQHAGASPSDTAYGAAMEKMMSAMHMAPTGDPDRDFVSMMLPHHQGAVDMAEVELKFGKDPVLLAMARAIVEAQTKEMADMRAWQAKTGK